jgi:hypothetical protein
MALRDFFRFGFPQSPQDILSKGPPEFNVVDLVLFTGIFSVVTLIPIFIPVLIVGGSLEDLKGLWADTKTLVLLMLLFSVLGGPVIYYFSLSQRRRFYLYTAAAAQATKLQDTLEEDFVTNLVKINFKYIDRYYLQTQLQADKSFRLASFISVVSFVIIALGVGMMYSQKTDLTPAYVTAGAGVLSQFISAVFFYLYNQTILKMGEYHRKLVLTQNISLALKISQELPDAEWAKAQASLIDRLSENFNLYLAQEGSASRLSQPNPAS